jgi:hypothetical protein
VPNIFTRDSQSLVTGIAWVKSNIRLHVWLANHIIWAKVLHEAYGQSMVTKLPAGRLVLKFTKYGSVPEHTIHESFGIPAIIAICKPMNVCHICYSKEERICYFGQDAPWPLTLNIFLAINDSCYCTVILLLHCFRLMKSWLVFCQIMIFLMTTKLSCKMWHKIVKTWELLLQWNKGVKTPLFQVEGVKTWELLLQWNKGIKTPGSFYFSGTKELKHLAASTSVEQRS